MTSPIGAGGRGLRIVGAATCIGEAIATVLGGLCVALLSLLLLVSVALIVARDALHSDLLWAQSVSAYLMVWLTYLGAAVATWRGEHFVIDVLQERLRPRPRALLRMVAAVASAALMLVWLLAGIDYLPLLRGQYAMLAPWFPLVAVGLAVPTGLGAMLVLHLLYWGRHFATPSTWARGESAGERAAAHHDRAAARES